MNAPAEDDHLRELVIIKRRAPADGDAHHGGVWKIAYADFMTAMMAFFLVMWLINAANEETRSQVASYFNPVKLVDSRTSSKGLQDLESGVDAKVKHEQFKGDAKGQEENAPNGGEGVADRSEGKSAHGQAAGEVQEHGESGYSESGPQSPQPQGKPGRLGGEAFLDPFDPQTWEIIQSEQIKAPVEGWTGGKLAEAAAKSKVAAPAATDRGDAEPADVQAEGAMAIDQVAQVESKRVEAALDGSRDKAAGQPAGANGRAGETEQEARQIEQEIKEAVERAAPGVAPGIEVRSTDQGVLISLTDNLSFGMFDIASDKPQAELVRYMEQIAKIIMTRRGTIIVSGHTDGRPFRSDTYDNWKLSSARAQAAYSMLVRGGVDEKRFERIEGHADRDLKVPANPEAAENRRIEILLHEVRS